MHLQLSNGISKIISITSLTLLLSASPELAADQKSLMGTNYKSGIVTGPVILQKDVGMSCAAFGKRTGVREEIDALQLNGIPFQIVDTGNPDLPEEICVFKTCRRPATKKNDVSSYAGWQEAFDGQESCMLKL